METYCDKILTVISMAPVRWKMEQKIKMWKRWGPINGTVSEGDHQEQNSEFDLWDHRNNMIGGHGQTSEHLKFI